MTPYYEHGNIRIYNGDCRDILPTLDRRAIIVSDPPYNIGFSGYDVHDDRMPEDDYIDLLCELQLFRGVAIIHYPEEMMRFVVPSLGPPLHVGAWCYNSPFPRRFRLINYYGVQPDYARIKQPYQNPTDKRVRLLIEAGNVGTNLYEWWTDIQQVKNVSQEKNGHPCPIPLRLAKRILALITQPGDLIVDPFMGGGTVIEAAQSMGLAAIGIDKSAAYCDMAIERLQQPILIAV